MRVVALLLLIVVVGLSPLALGSNRPLPWAYNAIAVAVCLMAACLVPLLRLKSYPSLQFNKIDVPLVCAGIVILYAIIQAIPLAIFDNPIWQIGHEILGVQAGGSISINPDETLWSILRFLTAMAVFLAVYILARQKENAQTLMAGLLLFAAAMALYGIVRVGFDIQHVLWLPVPVYNKLSSGFVGPNNAATFLGICAAVSFTFLVVRQQKMMRSLQGQSVRSRMDVMLSQMGGMTGLYLGLFVLFTASLLMTTSRGGTLSTMAGLASIYLLLAARGGGRKTKSGKGGFVLSVFLVVVLIVLIAEAAGGNFVSRLMTHGMASDLRGQVYSQTLLAIRDNVWLGTGLGTFQDVYPAYRLDSPSDRLVWDKAHNDYLELLLGLGVPVGVLGLAGFAGLFLRLCKGALVRRRDEEYAIAAVGVCIVAGLHGLVDFSMQIQGFTLYFAAFTGIGAAQSMSSRS